MILGSKTPDLFAFEDVILEGFLSPLLDERCEVVLLLSFKYKTSYRLSQVVKNVVLDVKDLVRIKTLEEFQCRESWCFHVLCWIYILSVSITSCMAFLCGKSLLLRNLVVT